MKEAKRALRQHRTWRSIKARIGGTITATEMTHGGNGWHPHFHEVLFIEAATEAEALALVAPLGDAWRASLRGKGLDGAAAAFDAQGAGAAGDYLAKWGAGEELTLNGAKRGRRGGRTPRQLLRAAGEGDGQARALWVEYFRATSGRRRRRRSGRRRSPSTTTAPSRRPACARRRRPQDPDPGPGRCRGGRTRPRA